MPHAVPPKCRALGRFSSFFSKKTKKCTVMVSTARGIAGEETDRR
jgi:hypothetical protein